MPTMSCDSEGISVDFFWKKKCCKNTKDDESVVNEIISEMYNMDMLGINLDARIYSWFLRH